MAERDRLEIGRGRLDPREVLEFLLLERALDGAQPVGPLRMAGGGEVVEAGGVGDEERGHGVLWFTLHSYRMSFRGPERGEGSLESISTARAITATPGAMGSGLAADGRV